MACFGRLRGIDDIFEKPDAFIILENNDYDQKKKRQQAYSALCKALSGDVCVFKKCWVDGPERKLHVAWRACSGRKEDTETQNVVDFCEWVDDFPNQWTCDQVYIADPERDPQNLVTVPCIPFKDFDRVRDAWSSDMFIYAITMAGAKSVSVLIKNDDGKETTNVVVETAQDCSKMRKGRYSLPRLSRRGRAKGFVLDFAPLESYIQKFGSKMISGDGRNHLKELIKTIKDEGRLEVDHLSWEMQDTLLEMLKVDLGQAHLGANEAIFYSHDISLHYRWQTRMVRHVSVTIDLFDDKEVQQALLEKLSEINHFMDQQTLYQRTRQELTGIAQRRLLETSSEEGAEKKIVRIVLLGGRGVGKSALLYTLKVIQAFLSPLSRKLTELEIQDLLEKPDGLVFNKTGDVTGTTTNREYSVVSSTLDETGDNKATLKVCDTPGMSMNQADHENSQKALMESTWDYVAQKIPPGQVEKISPLLVFNASEVVKAYKRREDNDDPTLVETILDYLDNTLLAGLKERGASPDGIVVVGTHADQLNDSQQDYWNEFVSEVQCSSRCGSSAKAFLVHNFGEDDFGGRSKRNLKGMWEELCTGFLKNNNNQACRAQAPQEAIVRVLEVVREREFEAYREYQSRKSKIKTNKQRGALEYFLYLRGLE